MSKDEQIINGFLQQACLVLAVLTSRQQAHQLSGIGVNSGFREQLAVAMLQIQHKKSTLTITEKVEVATFFLPLLRTQLVTRPVKVPPLLRLELVSPPTEDGAPAVLRSTVRPGDAILENHQLLRARQFVTASRQTVLLYTDERPQPAVPLTYTAQAYFSNYGMLEQSITLQPSWPLLYGFVDEGDLDAEAIAVLKQAKPTRGQEFTRLTFPANSHELRLMALFVPLTAGRLTKIRNQEASGETNLLRTFHGQPMTVNLGRRPIEGVLWLAYTPIRTKEAGYSLDFFLTRA